MTVSFQQQLELNSIVGRLVHVGSDTFDVDDAKRLREIVLESGLKSPAPIVFKSHSTTFSESQSAYAAGVGNVNLRGPEERSLELGDSKIVTGRWAIKTNASLKNTLVVIEYKFNDTKESEDEEQYRLRFNAQGEPTEFLKIVMRDFRVPLFAGWSFIFVRPHPVPYKRPAFQGAQP